MPSMSEAFRPASSIALRTAQVPSARVVIPEPRMYFVSPMPTMAYLSRRYFGLVVSVSAGIAMASSKLVLPHHTTEWGLRLACRAYSRHSSRPTADRQIQSQRRRRAAPCRQAILELNARRHRRRPRRARRRVREPAGPFGLRQEHPVAPDRGPERAECRAHRLAVLGARRRLRLPGRNADA